MCCKSPSAVNYNRKSILWCAHYIEFLSSVSGHMGVLTCRPRVTLGSNQFLSIPWFVVFISIAAVLSNSCYFQVFLAISNFIEAWKASCLAGRACQTDLSPSRNSPYSPYYSSYSVFPFRISCFCSVMHWYGVLSIHSFFRLCPSLAFLYIL